MKQNVGPEPAGLWLPLAVDFESVVPEVAEADSVPLGDIKLKLKTNCAPPPALPVKDLDFIPPFVSLSCGFAVKFIAIQFCPKLLQFKTCDFHYGCLGNNFDFLVRSK